MAGPRALGVRIGDDGTPVLEPEGDFCIQNVARRVHGRLVAGLLDGSLAGPAAERAVDRLTRFLAGTDFRRLRADDPELRGPLARPVRLVEDGAGRIEVTRE